MKRRAQRERGFTLVEVLIAIAVLVIGLVSIMLVFAMASRASSLAQQIANATTAGLDKMEQLRDLDFNTAPSLQPGGSLDTDIPNYSDTYVTGAGPTAYSYRRRWQVFDNTAAPPNQAPTPNSRVIVIRVLPTNTLSGTSKVVEMRTEMVNRSQ